MQVSNEEGDWLCQYGHKIDFHFPQPHPQIFPKWEYVTSVRTFADYRSFKPKTCNNGGDYAFYESEDWFVAVMPDGTTRYRYVHTYSTSAEFDYDDLNGGFQRTEVLELANALPAYATCVGGLKALEQISQIGEFSELWHSQCATYDNEETNYSKLSFSKKKEIIARLKELGIQKERTRRRGSLKTSRR